ncbi:MAG: DegV family protein [Lachnospiraceae bacterium]|nr:DegV family protein [Lachnospiraceae bacterium]
MRKVAIMTDSTSDLSKELIERYDITVFPLHIHLGEKEYADGVNITPDEIYAWSEKTKETPKTSALSLYDAKEYIKMTLEKGEEVICFCLSESMSSCCSVMFMAVAELGVEDKVFVIDSQNLSTGIGLQILEAARLAQQGLGGTEIVEQIKGMQSKVRSSFVVDSLTFLHRGGRCSSVAALAGNTLKLHPCISVQGGKMQAGKKYRGKMDKVIISYVEDLKPELLNAKKTEVFLTHSGCEENIILTIKEKLEELQYFENIYITRAGGVIASHCGPGTLGVLFVEE